MGDFHGGIDIAGQGIYGSSVAAAAEGTVITAGHHYSYGNYIIVDHGADDNGTSYATLYAHLSEIDVSYGSHVNAGQTIGKVGSTGNSTGPHLHFEVRVNGNRVNPMNFFSR
jgi:murein DD-endopeptidase MepM/ murein hydrolase activator NlpD